MIKKSKKENYKNYEDTFSGKEYLAFYLGGNEYAIDILTVQEVRSFKSITIQSLINTPEYFKGFINIHKEIVPIIDMRILYKIEPADYTDITVVIMLILEGKMVGIIVNSVTDILMLLPDQIKPPQFYKNIIDYSNVEGIGFIQDRMLIILNSNKLLSNVDTVIPALSQDIEKKNE